MKAVQKHVNKLKSREKNQDLQTTAARCHFSEQIRGRKWPAL